MVKKKAQTVRALPWGELRNAYSSTPELNNFNFLIKILIQTAEILMLLDVANISEKFNPLSRVATTSQTTDNRKKQGRYWGWSSWGEGQQALATTPTYPSWGVWGNAVSSPPRAFGGILLLTKHVQTTPRPKFSVTGEGGQQEKIGPTWKIWHNLTTDLKIKPFSASIIQIQILIKCFGLTHPLLWNSGLACDLVSFALTGQLSIRPLKISQLTLCLYLYHSRY